MRSADQLYPNRKSFARQTARQRDRRTAGQGDHKGEEHPVYVRGQLFAGDLNGEALLHGKRRYRNARADEKVVIIKEAREKLGYVMPGEVVLVQPQPKADLRNSALADVVPSQAPAKK